MIDLVQVGLRITELRKNAGLTQVRLAERLKITHQAVSKWETGVSLPDATDTGMHHLHCLAPFLSSEALNHLVRNMRPENIREDELQSLAAFL